MQNLWVEDSEGFLAVVVVLAEVGVKCLVHPCSEECGVNRAQLFLNRQEFLYVI